MRRRSRGERRAAASSKSLRARAEAVASRAERNALLQGDVLQGEAFQEMGDQDGASCRGELGYEVQKQACSLVLLQVLMGSGVEAGNGLDQIPPLGEHRVFAAGAAVLVRFEGAHR